MQDNSYSMVAAKWWVEKIIEILPAEAFWGKIDVEKSLNISRFIDSVSDGKKEIYINSLAKKIASHIKEHSSLVITYPYGIKQPGDWFNHYSFCMKVTNEKVEVWDEDGKSEIIYKKAE